MENELSLLSVCTIFANYKTIITAIVIGTDVGVSTIKIVGVNDDGTVVTPIRIKTTDPVTSLYGALGKYLHDNKIPLGEIGQVMLTGIGAAYVNDPVYGSPTVKAEEFICNGLGAQLETKLDDMIVVSMDTGTNLIQCLGNDIHHIGGTGLGGGTLTGSPRIMLRTDDIKQIPMLTTQGEDSNIGMRIGDISPNPLSNLSKTATTPLFDSAKSNASREGTALGIITMVLQTIGSGTILALLGTGIKNYAFIGNLTLLPQCKSIFGGTEKLCGVDFIIPKYSEFCTAIGVALYFIDKERK